MKEAAKITTTMRAPQGFKRTDFLETSNFSLHHLQAAIDVSQDDTVS